MTRLVDTTIRLLSQEPLAGALTTARLLRIAEELDQAGYAGLEVSGGGCFASAVERAVESPWERIRALKARAHRTPLVMALRGSFLVGPRPADAELVRRFILCAAESGIDVFRLHDPVNDVDDLQLPAEAVREAGSRFHAGLVYAEGPEGDGHLIASARKLGALGADRILLHDPAGALDPPAAGDLIKRLREAAGVPVGLYAQGPGGTALAVAIEAARAGADPIATATYPVAMLTLRAPSELVTQSLAGLGIDTGVDRERIWQLARLIDEQLGDLVHSAPPISPQVALRAALARVPAGLVAGLERRLKALGAPDRLDEVIEEVRRVRADCGYVPPASPVGRILATQAVQHVLSGRRWTSVDEEMRRIILGEYGHPPALVADAAREVAERTAPIPDPEPSLDDARVESGGLAASEEDLCLVALFGDATLPLLERMRGRRLRSGEDAEAVDDAETARVRRLVSLLEESDLSELTVEEEGVRITVRKPGAVPPSVAAPQLASVPAPQPPEREPPDGTIRIESPMVGTFYRAPSPTSPSFVDEGDTVEVGQTLCVLEAMKLFNELKSEHAGVVRRILAKNADLVEYGQPLFELVPA